MSIPNSTWTELTSTTLADYRDQLADNVLKHNPFLLRLMEKGNTDEADGGYTLLENLMYQQNSTFSWYSGYMQLNVTASDTITSAQFDWRQCNANVTISGLEQIQNAGREQKFSLIKSRILVAEKTLKNNVAASLFYSNTENSGLSIGGLQFLVADNPTAGTVGGISQAAQTWWQNQYYSFSGNSVTASATTIQAAMNYVYLRTLRGRDEIDLVLGGKTYFTYYWTSLQTQQRFTDFEKPAGAGFPAGLKYMNADCFYDPSETTGTRLYMLNTDYFHFRPSSERNFVVDPEKASTNQDAIVIPVYWAGNLTSSNLSLQGVVCT
jgi:hypothetical protein